MLIPFDLLLYFSKILGSVLYVMSTCIFKILLKMSSNNKVRGEESSSLQNMCWVWRLRGACFNSCHCEEGLHCLCK